VEIRELGPAHVAAAVALWTETGLTRPWNDADGDLRRVLGDDASTVLGGFSGEALAATVMVGHNGHRGWVYYLAVRPHRQGAGAGRRMLAAAEAWLRERGAVKVNLMVREDNEAVVAFYRRVGYEESRVRVLGRRLDGGGAAAGRDVARG
jgi:ribosomal protein S18 acetylase RimI-like enzyme